MSKRKNSDLKIITNAGAINLDAMPNECMNIFARAILSCISKHAEDPANQQKFEEWRKAEQEV